MVGCEHDDSEVLSNKVTEGLVLPARDILILQAPVKDREGFGVKVIWQELRPKRSSLRHSDTYDVQQIRFSQIDFL